jgi:hypothetical protein
MSMTEQDIRNAERLSNNLVRKSGVISYKPLRDSGTTNITRDAGPAGAFGPGNQYNFGGAQGSLTDQFTDKQTANIVGKTPMYGGTTPTGPQTTMGGFESLLAGLLGGGSGKGISASDALARDKFNYEKQQDDRKASGLSGYYTGGSYNTGFDALLKMIADQGKVSEQNVAGAYDRALGNINQGYQAAQTLGDEGYSMLNAYLTANQNNPYADMQATVGSAPDALSSYLGAYGVSDQPVQGQIQADQLQAQQGAGNYQNLIDTLGAIAQQGAGSRGAESQMAQLLFNTGLGQERAGYRSQAENAQAAALAQLQQQLFESRFGVEQNRNTLAQQLAQTVAELTGTAPNSNSGGNKPTSGQLPQTATQQEIITNQLANLLAPAQAQNSTAEQLLAELNARRGR